MGRKKKALLAEQGIVHLKHSFVQPTEESGLLKTVGGEVDRSGLILATGTYGYAIPMSSISKEGDGNEDSSKSPREPDFIEIVDEAVSDSEDVTVIQEVRSKKSKASETSSKLSSSSNLKGKKIKEDKETGKTKEINPDELSVAELVRVIGGGSGAPLRRCDVVDDREREKPGSGEGGEPMDTTDAQELEEDPEADEFYESLGIQKSKRRKLDNQEEDKGSEKIIDQQNMSTEGVVPLDEDSSNIINRKDEDPDMLESIASYYKDNASHLYYYSQQHTPYGQHRLEFGPYIDAEDSSEYDQDYIQLAKLAQRARAAAAAAALRSMQETQNAKEEKEKETEEMIYDPLPMEVVTSTKPEDLGITIDTNLEQYWEFVKEDPHDFDRWIYLIQYVENIDNLNACRSVYSAFLPLFPYCFGYWKRYAELEKKSYYFCRALAILEKGLEFIPLSVDLWLSYISLFKEVNAHQPDFEVIVRKEYERALNTCGMEFRSDSVWEAYIDWESENKRLKKAFTLFRRLIQVPTRLYNRHWDNIQLLVRDHHPRDFLEYEEYESMRKKGCKKLGYRYKPEPEVEAGEIRKTLKPEDKLMDYTKSKILKQITSMHVKCEEAVNKRWVFEDKIKRPYFHTKPLDKFQLRNWEEYLNFEIDEKNHDRIVLLFERCVISCANYEEFWSKYARYVEGYHKEHTKDMNVSVHVLKSKINEELVSRKETEIEEARIADVKEVLDNLIGKIVGEEEAEKEAKNTINSLIDKVIFMEEDDNFVFNKLSTVAVNQLSHHMKVGESGRVVDCPSPDLGGNQELPPKSGISTDNDIHSKPSTELTSLLSVPVFPEAEFRWQETVRDIYKRACIIHCPKKPIVRLQWAAYEEELGNLEESRKLIQHVLHWFPNFLDAKLQLLDLERRAGNHTMLTSLYDKFLSLAKSVEEYSLLSNKYARFTFKELGKPDKALTIMRKAIRKDKGNPALYSYVFDICYERYPSDRKGAAASLELAILSKDLTEETKLIFLRRKMLFFQEHGDIKRVRDAVDQLRVAEEKMKKIKAEEQRKRDEEEKEILFLRSAALKQLQQNVQNDSPLQAYPVPDQAKAPDEGAASSPAQATVPIEFEQNGECNSIEQSSGPIRAQIVTEGRSVSEAIKDGPELPYQKVPPPADLRVDSSTYGYGSKHPDMKIMENMAQKEYEKLEAYGYPSHMKDTDDDKKYLRQQAKLKHSTKDPTYIVAPTSSYSVIPVGPPPKRRTDPPAPGEFELQPPRAMAILPVPSTAPCVNVPDWFIKEGGELCISESRLGFSTLRYWPHFLTEIGNERMYRSVRRHVKWHQKQKIIAGHWRYLHRLVSWLGPCDFTHNGMVLEKCEDWPPEILDQLHRINKMVNHEFNACSLDLYRHGHDWNSWHSENLPAYGSNPPLAIVTLGSLRILEMKRKGPEFNYLRFPLFPGSLFLMEGVTQADWAHQIIKDPLIKDETLMLVFRIMHAIELPDPETLKPKKSELLPRRIKDDKKFDDPKIGPSLTMNRKYAADENDSAEPTGSPIDKNTEVSSINLNSVPENDKHDNTKIIFHKVR